MSDKLMFVNRVVVRVTWFFLAIGVVDHFVYEFLPYPWAGRNLNLLWVLIAILVSGEIIAFVVRRRRAG